MRVFNLKQEVISDIDHSKLHRYIINNVSIEFSNMVENCYYPKVSKLWKDLLHMTKSKEKELIVYSKQKYKNKNFYLLHDPYTTLLVLIIQEFLQNKDMAAAESTFHLFALRTYTNLLYRGTTGRGSRVHVCNTDYFQAALDNLSKNHIYVKQKTIPNSIMYYSRAVMKRYLDALKNDDAPKLHLMIYEMRTRLAQSSRSFFRQYYKARDEKDMLVKSKEEMEYDKTHETKLRTFIGRVSKDMCVYGKVEPRAAEEASKLIKFNKKLSIDYSNILSNPMFAEEVETALYLLVKDINDLSVIRSTKFVDYVQKMMSIKVTKQTVYFKKTISDIHIKVIKQLNLEKWYNKLSIQSKSISRNFIAYYLAFYIRKYV